MKIKQTMYVIDGLGKNGLPELSWCELEFSTTLGTVEVEVEFEMPSRVELRDRKVETLKCEIMKVKADARIKIERIEDYIQSLMAIEA